MQDTTQPEDAGRPRAVFYLIVLAFPLLFFAVLEGGIRLFGLAPVEPLFVDGPPGYLRPNEAVVKRFFIHPSRAPRVSIDTTFFQRDKPDDLFRVVVQGGSSAAGFPYGKWASPAGMLGQRLKRVAPDRQIEMISTAMSAVNSYALLDFAQEIIDIEPDVVLIYAGHNEYLGILGVGSTFGAGYSPITTRFLLTLRRLHLFRAMQWLYGAMSGPSADGAAQRSGTLMARVARDRAIAYDSTAFRSGVEQFAHNLDALLAKYAEAGIPVLIGTVVSNEGGQAPFINAPGAATSLSMLRELAPAAPAEANNAQAFFQLGDELRSEGRTNDARRAYVWARDLDALRFRAPSAMNEVIAETAAAHSAVVVDVEGALAGESPDGIVGNELMLEHLHPNLRGYFLLADAYFDALTSSVDAQRWPAGPDREAAWQEIPVTEIDALGGEYRLRFLKSDWPFQQEKQPVNIEKPRDEVERIAQDWFFGRIGWPQAMQQALVHYQRAGRMDEAAKVALNLADAFPFEANLQYVSGRVLLATQEPARALAYLERATRMAPGKADGWLALNEAYVATGQERAARNALEEVLRRYPDNAEARRRLE